MLGQVHILPYYVYGFDYLRIWESGSYMPLGRKAIGVINFIILVQWTYISSLPPFNTSGKVHNPSDVYLKTRSL